MSEPNYDPELDDENDNENEQQPNWRRELERKAKKADANALAAQTAQRELAFYKAGLPMDDKRMEFFVKGYDGDLTPEAIRKAASDSGFIQPSAQDTALGDEIRQHQQISEASSGASTAGTKSHDEILVEAQRAAEAVPAHQRAQVFRDYLAAHGLTTMQMPPS